MGIGLQGFVLEMLFPVSVFSSSMPFVNIE